MRRLYVTKRPHLGVRLAALMAMPSVVAAQRSKTRGTFGVVTDYAGRCLGQRETSSVHGGLPFTIARHLTPTRGATFAAEQQVVDATLT